MSEPVKILVIDDSEDDRFLYKRCLQKSVGANYAVSETSNGEDGLTRIEKELFACVLLDYSLPGRNGVEILKRIRARHPFVPVVMLTGLGNEKVAVEAMQEGAQNYISKATIDPQTLAHVIEVAIRHCGMQDRISEQRGSLELFARALAHDLMEPVRTIRTLLDLLDAEASFEGTIKGHFQSIRYAAERLSGLMDSVHIYARLDASEPAKVEVCDVTLLVEAAKENISYLIRGRRPVITCSLLPRISINREQGIQIFQNLLGNAIQNCRATPRIDISATEANDYWLFRVGDNGAGIGKEDAEKLFKPFNRMSRHDLQGPGLGLATCRRILELHGGKIWCESEIGKGADFIFTVPKAAATSGAIESLRVSSPPEIARNDRAGWRIATLLMVDDDEMSVELARMLLIESNRLQCKVLVAHDGEEALARLHDTDIDLVLLDINMPRMDGFELLQRMRDEKILDRVAVVMCSTSNYAADISRAKELGACGYLTKPPDLGRLKLILERSTELEITRDESNSHFLLRAA